MVVETNCNKDRLLYRGGLNTLMVNLSINGIRSIVDFTAARLTPLEKKHFALCSKLENLPGLQLESLLSTLS